jgi:flagellar basal body rod protein FlgF
MNRANGQAAHEPAAATATNLPRASTTGPRLSLHAIFSVQGDDEERAYARAAQLIDRLSALANTPECECDVDISVERMPSRDQGCG